MTKSETVTHSTPLGTKWVQAILNMPTTSDTAGSILDRLNHAKAELQGAIQEANALLEDNPVVEMLAAHLGSKGEATVQVDVTGTLVLSLTPYAKPKTTPVVIDDTPAPTKTKPPRKKSTNGKPPSKVSALDLLREEARAIGVNPTPYGRSKAKIKEAMAKHLAGAAMKPTPAPAVEEEVATKGITIPVDADDTPAVEEVAAPNASDVDLDADLDDLFASEASADQATSQVDQAISTLREAPEKPKTLTGPGGQVKTLSQIKTMAQAVDLDAILDAEEARKAQERAASA